MELFIGGLIGVAMVVFVILAGIVFMKDRGAPPDDDRQNQPEDPDQSSESS